MENVAGKSKRKKGWKSVLIIVSSVLAALILALLLLAGFAFAGPLKTLSIIRIESVYRDRKPGSIIFYGASNFALWHNLEDDMFPFSVQNHGFGGSTDNDLMHFADRILFPFEPSIVVFQSGSNDFMHMTVDEIFANKHKMFTVFRRELPDATFVVMSMLPLPGRNEISEESIMVNNFLREYCAENTDMIFIDSTDIMMTSNGDYRPELFRKDGIHLNREGQLLWGALIKQELEKITS